MSDPNENTMPYAISQEYAQKMLEEHVGYQLDLEPETQIVKARADGVLMTREEWAETLDLEAAAEAEHDQWMRWVQTIIHTEPGLSPERMARWVPYMVPYAMLSDDVKEYDRIEARKCLAAALGEDTK